MKNLFALLVSLSLMVGNAAADTSSQGVVVLLHGLAKSGRSMNSMERALTEAGFKVCNVSYPSRKYSIEDLAIKIVLPEIAECAGDVSSPLNFVTHSMGGIIVRQLQQSSSDLAFGRVVMLAPPNGGSELVDEFGRMALYERIGGPAARQLGTQGMSVATALGPTDLELGIIAGRHTFNPFLSLLIPGRDDGKVAIEKCKLEGMRDFLVVPVSHPFIMKRSLVIQQTILFLRTGQFQHDIQQTASTAAAWHG